MSVADDKQLLIPQLPELMRLETDSERALFLSRHAELAEPKVVEELAVLVLKQIRVDPHEALRLAEAAVSIASSLRRADCEALALRTKADALYACGDNRGAVRHHDQAYQRYAAAADLKEAARTLSHSIQPLILSGEYDRAFAAAQKARELFTQLGDRKRLASLNNNVGNIFHRQDRFAEAIEHYGRAYKALTEFHEWEHAAIALSNMAMCLISLNDFQRSLECYQRARELCVNYGMPRLRDQADYNIAYLYYLRGEYNRAIGMLVATRQACEANGDGYHEALCYLDLSDIYVELNLVQEARETAREGFLLFQKLGLGYEAAKTLTNEAIAYGKQGQTLEALKRFSEARQMFFGEGNVVWQRLLDLYEALLLFRSARYGQAQKLCLQAASFFDREAMPGKASLAHLLLAQIALARQNLGKAQKEADFALAKLSDFEAPLLSYEIRLLLGHIALQRGDDSAAYASYEQSRAALETLRTRLQREELKISFVRNRLEVYEALVNLHLRSSNPRVSASEALGYIEAAKSRSMLEALLHTGQDLPSTRSNSKQTQRVHDLRAELNWYYHRMELEQLRPETTSLERIAQLQREARAREGEMQKLLRELPVQEWEGANLETPIEFSLKALQAGIANGTTLIEYYSAGDRLIAAVVTREAINIRVIAQVSRVSELLHLLRFQLSKFRMGPVFTEPFREILLRTTESHLEALYDELVKPVRGDLAGDHLVFVPHGPLHFLPFHALRNEDGYLGDAYTISYAPSATLYAFCQQKAASAKCGSIIFGIPDERAPHIGAEATSVATLLPDSELYLGETATSKVLRNKGGNVDIVHIATHGIYRQDNPMFSAIRLGDGYLNLYDLYQLKLSANLVTLSGCATGMNFVAAGDELLGLQRGLFYAGATSLLLSLWDVHDRSTAELMQEFYRHYMSTGDMAASLQRAARMMRQENRHPYYWAPFVLVGKVGKSAATPKTE